MIGFSTSINKLGTKWTKPKEKNVQIGGGAIRKRAPKIKKLKRSKKSKSKH